MFEAQIPAVDFQARRRAPEGRRRAVRKARQPGRGRVGQTWRNTMRAGRSRSWAAWVTSALLHALIAVVALRAGDRAARRAPEPPTPEAVELDFEVRPDPSPAGPT